MTGAGEHKKNGDRQGMDPVKTEQGMVGHPLPEDILEQMY
jgi:hypothetical protein